MPSSFSAFSAWLLSWPWPDVALAFLAIVLEGLPFLLLGALISALLDLVVPGGLLARIVPRSPVAGLLFGLAAGFVLPVCECGSVPVAARLLRKGVPMTAAVTYLLSAPLVNPLTLFTTWVAFQGRGAWEMVAWRLGIGVGVLLIIGWWLGRLQPRQVLRGELLLPKAESAAAPPALAMVEARPGRLAGLARFVRTTLADFLPVLVFLIFGAALAAFAGTALDRALVAGFAADPWLGPLIGVAAAQLLCLCSTTDAFVIASIPAMGFAGQLAFLVVGPILDLKLLVLYRAIFTRGFLFALWLRVTGLVLVVCWALAWWIASQ